MSDAATRQRRTVPLTASSHHKNRLFIDEGGHSIPTEENSIGSSSLSAKQKSEVSVSSRRLEPIRQSFLNNTSGHSKQKPPVASAPRSRRDPISTSELKRSMLAKQRNGDRRSGVEDPRTPSGHAKLFSIGKDQIPLTMLPPLQRHHSTGSPSSHNHQDDKSDMSGLEESLKESGLNKKPSFTKKLRTGSLTKATFAVRTTFEVDAPRGEGPSRRSSRGSRGTRTSSPSGRSVDSEPVNRLSQHLSEEQDAWAGIDALLETQSMNDSFCFSTSDILPKAVVRAMRREPKEGLVDLDEETVWGDEASDAGESRQSKRSVESISKASKSSSSSDSSRPKGQSTTRKSKTGPEGHSSSFKKNQESWSSKEERDKVRQDAGLFDMFQWSAKDNVDEQRTRKGKLNNQARKIKLLAPLAESQQDSDSASLPSLATCRADDFSVYSNAQSLDWDTYHSGDLGSVVTENSRDEFGGESVHGNSFHGEGAASLHGNSFHGDGVPPTIPESSSVSGSRSGGLSTKSRNNFAGDGLVLDKGVDEYIRKIQRNLPTITEDENSPVKKGKKKHVGFAFEEEESSSPSPISVVPEETAFDTLPSLLSGRQFDPDPKAPSKKGRKEEKKEPPNKPSLTFLMSSIKRITTKAKAQKKLGDEEKYFPDEMRAGDASKKDNDNRCLLNQGDDGVNWDAD